MRVCWRAAWSLSVAEAREGEEEEEEVLGRARTSMSRFTLHSETERKKMPVLRPVGSWVPMKWRLGKSGGGRKSSRGM